MANAYDSLAQLIKEQSYLQAGGGEENDLTKVDRIVGSVQSLKDYANSRVTEKLTNAKTKLENQKSEREALPASVPLGILAPDTLEKAGSIVGRNVPPSIVPQGQTESSAVQAIDRILQTTPKESPVYQQLLDKKNQIVGRQTLQKQAEGDKQTFDTEALKRKQTMEQYGAPQDFSGTMGELKDAASTALSAAGVPLKQAQTVKALREKDPKILVEDIISNALGIPQGEYGKDQYNAMVNAIKIKLGKEKQDNPNKKISITEALALGVPFGTTVGEVEGMIPRSQSDKNQMNKFNGAFALLGKIESLTDDIPLSVDPGILGRVGAGIENLKAQWSQSNPAIPLLDSTVGQLTTLIRALGDTGNVAVQERLIAAEKLMPVVVPTLTRLPDTRKVAKQKTVQIKQMLQEAIDIYVNSLQTPMMKGDLQGKTSTPEQTAKTVTPSKTPKDKKALSVAQQYLEDLKKEASGVKP